MTRTFSAFAICLTHTALLASAGTPLDERDQMALKKWPLAPAPSLSPEDALKAFQIEEGFRIELVAAEPMVVAPVALDFDSRGRIWVVEMPGYMPNADGRGEDVGNGRVSILEDTNGDGRTDKHTVFLDNLVLPRAICVVDGGILLAEPPVLSFIENKDDKPGRRTIIDPQYAAGGNPEHMANGLVWNIDNHLYNAGVGKRLWFGNGQWNTLPTEGRGQWGICQNDHGRLFYNNNSNQLLADETPAGFLARNPLFKCKRGTNVSLCADQRIYLQRTNPGINRTKTLDDNGRIKSFTGACGPVIYRGDQFPSEFKGNAFICEPCANMVRRCLIEKKDGKLTARPASIEREFLTSTDMRFRPVNLYNAPDGSLYLVDFARGIIQHRIYLTDYLKSQSLHAGLDQPLDRGRIWRIVHEGKVAPPPPRDMAALGTGDLVAALTHDRGWMRDQAQRLLVARRDSAATPLLTSLVADDSSPLAQMHALRTLEGTQSLTPAILTTALKSNNPATLAAALLVADSLVPGTDIAQLAPIIRQLAKHEDYAVRLHALGLLARFPEGDPATFVTDLLTGLKSDPLAQCAVISGLSVAPATFSEILRKSPSLSKLLADNAADKPTRKLDASAMKIHEEGRTHYIAHCAGCHQADGGGFQTIAPPLTKSEWVAGPPRDLGLIILCGIMGPVRVGGKLYEPPDILPLMPGHAAVPELGDPQTASLMTYLRNTFGNNAPAVSTEQVREIRKEAATHPQPYLPEELRRTK